MPTKPLVLLAGIALTATAPAAIIFNVDGIGPTATATPSAGAGGSAVVTVAHSPATFEGEASGTITVTITGLTLDANGTADDSATAQFLLTSSGSGGDTIDDNGNDWGVNGNGAGRISDASESLTVSLVSGSATLGAGSNPGDSATFVFKGFNQFLLSQFDNPDGDIATLTIGAGSPTNITTAETSYTANPDSITIGYAAGGTTNDGFKLNHFRARIELDVVSIPEPSIALSALLGLGGLLLRRSRQ